MRRNVLLQSIQAIPLDTSTQPHAPSVSRAERRSEACTGLSFSAASLRRQETASLSSFSTGRRAGSTSCGSMLEEAAAQLGGLGQVHRLAVALVNVFHGVADGFEHRGLAWLARPGLAWLGLWGEAGRGLGVSQLRQSHPRRDNAAAPEEIGGEERASSYDNVERVHGVRSITRVFSEQNTKKGGWCFNQGCTLPRTPAPSQQLQPPAVGGVAGSIARADRQPSKREEPIKGKGCPIKAKEKVGSIVQRGVL